MAFDWPETMSSGHAPAQHVRACKRHPGELEFTYSAPSQLTGCVSPETTNIDYVLPPRTGQIKD